MLSQFRTLLLLTTLASAAGCSATIDTEAVDGRIEYYRHVDDLQRSVRISWKCRTTGILSSLFSTSGDTGCNEERGRGAVNLPISPEGTFEIPALDVKVIKFFSSPSLYFEWEIVTANEDTEVDTETLIRGKVHGNKYFKEILSAHRTLRFIAFEDACVETNVTARDGANQFPLEDISRVYPHSSGASYLFYLSATLRRNGQVVRTQYLDMDYDGGRFCGTGMGMHVPAGDEAATYEISLGARIDISAGVVYSVSPPDPVSGQRKKVARQVGEVIGREAKIPLALVNRIPDKLLEPVELELDITQPTSVQ